MDHVLRGLRWQKYLVYLDDIIILGKTFDETLGNLRCVMKRLKIAGLKLKASKCQWFRKSVKYLGHIVSAEGVASDPEKDRSSSVLAGAMYCDASTTVFGLCFLLSQIYSKFFWNCQTPYQLDKEVCSICVEQPVSECVWELEGKVGFRSSFGLSTSRGAVHPGYYCQ